MSYINIRSLSVSAGILGLCVSAGLADTGVDPAALRTKAKGFVAALPDRMPGAEKDTSVMIKLGEKLYFEKRLSLNEKMSCNTCHLGDQGRAGADNEPTSLGVHGKRGDRNSPTTLNAGFHFAQFWDGRAKDLEEQAKGPVLNPVEMAMPDQQEVVKRLKADKEYPALFKTAFAGTADPITYDNVSRAIAAFERTLITRDRFDDFLKGDDSALTPLELTGLNLFLSTGCTTCHTGPTIGGNMYQKIGLLHPYENKNDLGRIKVTNEEWDEYRFKVPSLRNVALTYPYFHDGAVDSLRSAITKMAYLQLDKTLSNQEVDALQAFLQTLSDKNRKPAK